MSDPVFMTDNRCCSTQKGYKNLAIAVKSDIERVKQISKQEIKNEDSTTFRVVERQPRKGEVLYRFIILIFLYSIHFKDSQKSSFVIDAPYVFNFSKTYFVKNFNAIEIELHFIFGLSLGIMILQENNSCLSIDWHSFKF